MKKNLLKWWAASFLQLIVPDRCRVCKVHLHEDRPVAICEGCLKKVDYLSSPGCRICGKVLQSTIAAGSICGGCLRKRPYWDKAMSVVSYGPVVRELLYALKYRNDTTVVPALQTIILPFIHSHDLQFSHVLPVPLHVDRMQERGMNQAVHLAKLFFPDQPELIKTTLLRRNRATLPQTGLDGVARRRNLRGVFEIMDPDAVFGKRVCIIDDVFTTGTTVAECSRVVRQAGASEITVITLARVVVGTTNRNE